MSSSDELFATRFIDLPGGGVSAAAQQRMARELGADSLRYLPVEAIARSVSLSPERLCRACITGQYPTDDRPGSLPDRRRFLGPRQQSQSCRRFAPMNTSQCRDPRGAHPLEPTQQLTVPSVHPVQGPVDRPAFEAVLPLEVGQVIEVVLGFLDPAARHSTSCGTAATSVLDHIEILLDVAGDVQLAAGLQHAHDRGHQGSVNTRRFLCRFFHHGSGK